jgi:alkylhydroperoxidase/carboxymuconolactone decarboxylase family protein YurZ
MYLPKIYEKFPDTYPGLMNRYQELGKACRKAGPLEEKYQDLIKLGIAIGSNSKGAVMSSVRKALASGASDAEIGQTVLLSLTTTGFPNMIAAMGWVMEVLDKQTQEG